jgi:uncharacterized protein (UPF0276 family)
LPDLGVGVALRSEIEAHVASAAGLIDWLEVITEDFLFTPRRREAVVALREQFPLIPHGVELSIGSEAEPDPTYLDALAELVELVGAPWCSDHLCFTRAHGIALGALISLTRTPEVAEAVARRAQRVQQHVGVPFLLENVSSFIDVGGPLSEAQFVTHVMEHCDCGLLLDLTNVYNNARNLGLDPLAFIDSIPVERVVQVHVAGGTWAGDILQDDHSANVFGEVWDLLAYALPKASIRGVLIERDGKLPDDFPHVLADVERARQVCASAAGGAPR